MLSFESGPARVRVATSGEGLLFGADAANHETAEKAINELRFAVGADDDLSAFHSRFSNDPVIGRSVRARPHLRPHRRPRPWEALAWGVTEQLIEYVRAAAIQRRIIRRIGPTSREWGLSDVPAAAAMAALAPAELVAMDLAAARASALLRVSAAVVDGRVRFDLQTDQLIASLTRFPGIGTWTAEVTALHGLGDLSVVPAGDLGYMKMVGRQLSGGDPKAFATEQQVREFFEPYAPWGGLAAAHMMSA
jgi:3-methyladenine DNA glycosylase/8-oxoguanine DNA glycosylase